MIKVEIPKTSAQLFFQTEDKKRVLDSRKKDSGELYEITCGDLVKNLTGEIELETSGKWLALSVVNKWIFRLGLDNGTVSAHFLGPK